MIKNLLITYLFLITNVFAGLPPTTVKGQAEAVKTTTFNVEVPYSQATTTAAGTRLLEVGNNNILANGSFEHSTYDTGWTCSLGTKTKETTTVFKGKNSMKIVSAGAGTRCYIYSTTDAAKLKGQQGHATVRVNSTDSVLQVCALAGGTTSAFDTNCVTVPVTTTDAPWKTVVIPTIMDGTGNGVVIKSAETLTKTVFVDEVEYKHGLPVQSVNGARLVGEATYTSGTTFSTTSGTFVTVTSTSQVVTYSGVSAPTTTNAIGVTVPSMQQGTYVIEANGFTGGDGGGVSNALPTYSFGSSDIPTATTCGLITSTGATAGASSASASGSLRCVYNATAGLTNKEFYLKLRTGAGGTVNLGINPGAKISVWYFPPTSTIYSSDNYKTVSSDTLPFAFKSTAIVDSDPIGTFNTYTYAANTNTATISASAPTQTVASMNANGVQVFARAFNVSSTSAQPTRVDIKIGKGLKTKEVLAYGDLAKVNALSYISNSASNASEDYNTTVSYDEVSGVLTINAGVSPSTITLRRVGTRLSDYLTYSSGYFTFNAQKNDTINGSFENIEKCANALECVDEFSVEFNDSGVITRGNEYAWVNGNATYAAGEWTVNFTSGIFTVAPICQATPFNLGASRDLRYYNTTTSSIKVATYGSGSATQNGFSLTCKKTGVDYKPKTAKVAVSTGVNRTDGVETPKTCSFRVAGASFGSNCTASTCNIYNQVGNCHSTTTRNATGDYTTNFINGFWTSSTSYNCVIGVGQFTGGTQDVYRPTQTQNSISVVNHQTNDIAYDVFCHGY